MRISLWIGLALGLAASSASAERWQMWAHQATVGHGWWEVRVVFDLAEPGDDLENDWNRGRWRMEGRDRVVLVSYEAPEGCESQSCKLFQYAIACDVLTVETSRDLIDVASLRASSCDEDAEFTLRITGPRGALGEDPATLPSGVDISHGWSTYPTFPAISRHGWDWLSFHGWARRGFEGTPNILGRVIAWNLRTMP